MSWCSFSGANEECREGRLSDGFAPDSEKPSYRDGLSVKAIEVVASGSSLAAVLTSTHLCFSSCSPTLKRKMRMERKRKCGGQESGGLEHWRHSSPPYFFCFDVVLPFKVQGGERGGMIAVATLPGRWEDFMYCFRCLEFLG